MQQKGSGWLATFDSVGNSPGVSIKRVEGDNHALYLHDNKTNYATAYIENDGSGHALFVKQEGSGWLATFDSVGNSPGVSIKGVEGDNHALYLHDNKTNYATAYIENDGSGTALFIKQEGSGKLAKFYSKTSQAKFVVDCENNATELVQIALYQAETPVWKPSPNLADSNLFAAGTQSVISNALESIGKLEGITFAWKDKALGTQKEFGIDAQQLSAVFPELVDSVDGQFGLVKYEKLVPILIEAIKELQAEVQALKRLKFIN